MIDILFELVRSNVFFVEFIRSFGMFEGFDPREEGREVASTRRGGSGGRPGGGRRGRA